MTNQFDYDVFLSHNHKDKPRVRKLAERLRQAGLKVWLDEWVIQPGDDIYLAVERGLEVTRVLLLCLSEHALGSGWVTLERSTAIHRDPANAGRRFIPLLLRDCELPDTLRRYKYVDFREEAEAAFEELLRACRITTEEVSAIASHALGSGSGTLERSTARRLTPFTLSRKRRIFLRAEISNHSERSSNDGKHLYANLHSGRLCRARQAMPDSA